MAQHGGFSDVTEGVHKPAIDALAERGALEGTLCGEDTFCPGEPITRSDMAVWLIRVLDDGDPPALGESRFADVDADAWWAPYVERLAELEITVGCRREPLRYCPDQSVNRGQMATFLVRAFDLQDAESAGFADTGGNTHAGAIDALAAAAITVGCKKDPLRYCPEAHVARAQMATLLARALGLVQAPAATSETTSDAASTDSAADEGPVLAFAFSNVGAGVWHACGVRVNGAVICWGYNHHGQADTPAGTFSAVSGGALHSCGLRADGATACWGNNADGRADAPEGTFTSVSAGSAHTCGVRADGTIECWGLNTYSDGTRSGQSDAPEGPPEAAFGTDRVAPPILGELRVDHVYRFYQASRLSQCQCLPPGRPDLRLDGGDSQSTRLLQLSRPAHNLRHRRRTLIRTLPISGHRHVRERAHGLARLESCDRVLEVQPSPQRRRHRHGVSQLLNWLWGSRGERGRGRGYDRLCVVGLPSLPQFGTGDASGDANNSEEDHKCHPLRHVLLPRLDAVRLDDRAWNVGPRWDPPHRYLTVVR